MACAVISERRPTAQRERALQELDALLGGSLDRDAALAHLKGVTQGLVEKAAAKAGVRAALAPPSPTPGLVERSPSPATRAPAARRSPPAPAIPPTRELLAGATDAKERLRRVRALRETLPANGEAQPPVAARRRSPAPAPPAYDSSEERSAFDADSTSDESSDEPPPPSSDAKASAGAAAAAVDDRAPPPTYEAADRVAVLRAVFERSLGPRPGADRRAYAGAVAAALEADAAAIAAWGERPVALASGFLRTLGQDRVDLDAVCEVLARSAAARR